MTDSTPRAGRCLCGGVRYAINGPARDVVVCHCSRCRRTHGHVGAYTSCAVGDLELQEAGSLRWYQDDGRSRGFCGACGASMFWRMAVEDTVSIAAGTLDEPTGLRIIAHIYTASRGDYYELPDGGGHFPGSMRDGA